MLPSRFTVTKVNKLGSSYYLSVLRLMVLIEFCGLSVWFPRLDIISFYYFCVPQLFTINQSGIPMESNDFCCTCGDTSGDGGKWICSSLCSAWSHIKYTGILDIKTITSNESIGSVLHVLIMQSFLCFLCRVWEAIVQGSISKIFCRFYLR